MILLCNISLEPMMNYDCFTCYPGMERDACLLVLPWLFKEKEELFFTTMVIMQ